MDKKELDFILQEGENEKVEFKPSLSQMNEIVQAISGFANLRGGIIFIGISNKGAVLGCNIGAGSIENLANIINQNTEPKVHPEISIKKIDECDKYIREHIAIMSRLHPMEVEREDISEYGLFSIRELITNAVCHRDYSEQRSKVIVKMFNDYIEIYNPGGLAQDITPKNIIQKQFSRNPIIAKALSKVKYIEDLGEGWDKIIKEHKEHVLKPELPRITADKSSMLVTIFSCKSKFEGIKEKPVLNERQRKAAEYVKEHGHISISQYIGLNNVSDKTARRDLTELVRKGIMIKEGITTNLKFKLRST